MTSKRQGWIGLGAIAALTGIGLALGLLERAPRVAVVDNPRRRRRRPPELDLEREIRACQRAAMKSAGPSTYRRKDDGVRALLEANPHLFATLEGECGPDCYTFKRWHQGGRRGPKPAGRYEPDGRFDAFNERWELRGRRRVGNLLEGVYATAPSSRRWEDFSGRVPVLEEATGLRINLPAPADRIAFARASADRCNDIELADVDVAGVPF